MRVCIAPTYSGPDHADGGIRRVVDALVQHLPSFDVQVTTNPHEADLLNVHGTITAEASGVPVVSSCHGMYWHDYDWPEWGHDANRRVIDSLTRADAITAPSQWVAHAITRGMLAQPTVIYHGVDADLWTPEASPLGYVLWNKARTDPVSNPEDMQRVAGMLKGVPFVSTFGQPTENVHVCGAIAYEQMRPIVQRAGVYLATARETFGIGTLEALAAGVPVVGWRYGGQAEIIRDGETGYLAPYGDYDALAECIQEALLNRKALGANARADALARWGWRDKVQQYAELFYRTARTHYADRPKVSVVVTCYNLGRYLDDALRSVAAQTMTDLECVIVDDGSTDDSKEIARGWAERDPRFMLCPTPTNLKLSGARNYGWQHANGRYVLFLDADDMLSPNALDPLSRSLDQHPDLHIVYGHLDLVDYEGKQQRRADGWPFDSFDYRGQISHLNQMPYASMLRRTVLERSGGYRTRDWRAEDAALWTRLTSFGFRAAKVTQDSTLIYRLRSDSKSADEGRQHEDRDGDWTAWYPWRIAGSAQTGAQVYGTGKQPNAQLVPWGAQGDPPKPYTAWPVRHHQHPAVSVIIPVGPGHAHLVADALDSVQAQTLQAWECIVVNDTGAPLDLSAWPWAVYREARNPSGSRATLGAGAARNAGLWSARAPLSLFLDADDILTPRALEAMAHAYRQAGGGYVYSDWLRLEEGAQWDGPYQVHEVPEYHPLQFLHGFQHPVTALVETEAARLVGGFDADMPAWEDWDFFNKLAVAGYCGTRVAAPLMIYRQATGTRRKIADALEETLLALMEERYGAYRSGDKAMPGSCCGGNAPALNNALFALDDLIPNLPPALVEAQGETNNNGRHEPAVLVMEFIGPQQGAQTFLGRVTGKAYRGGRNRNDQYIEADPRDVPHLEALGVWQRVGAR